MEDKVRCVNRCVLVQFPLGHIQALDKLVELGYYPNRNSAIRDAVRDLLKFHASVIEAEKVLQKKERKK